MPDSTHNREHLAQLSKDYCALHTQKEDAFWAAKMGLGGDLSKTRSLATETEKRFSRFVSDPKQVATLKSMTHEGSQKRVAEGWLAMFEANSIESPEGRSMSEELLEREAALEKARMEMELGMIEPGTSAFVRTSSNRLRLIMATDPSETRRKAAFDGLRSIEPYVLKHGFLDIAKLRNKLARHLGYSDYYAWRVWIAERMKKDRLFDLLTELADRTRDACDRSVAALVRTHGDSAKEPYNAEYLKAGKLSEALDPYYPFAQSFDRWVRGFTALGIRYRGATLKLDLVSRQGKYENGFMHGPEPAFFDNGEWKKARIHFTANAVPGQVGSGLNATRTFFHEGGHAAHFANIQMDAPCFSQEFAPTSVGYAETQSMFLDSLIKDADFRMKYATTEAGEPMPMELIEHAVREEQPFRAFRERSMLTIPFAERALYDMSDDEMTPDHVLSTFRRIEGELSGLNSGLRPVLSVPHLLAGEASAYYHGYVLADMGVSQTRHHFLKEDGYLTDNPNIGPALTEHYWKQGNGVSFDDTLRSLTGTPLSPEPLIEDANRSVDDAIALCRQAASRGRQAASSTPGDSSGPTRQLNAQIEVVHGEETIFSAGDDGLAEASETFATWIHSLEKAQ